MATTWVMYIHKLSVQKIELITCLCPLSMLSPMPTHSRYQGAVSSLTLSHELSICTVSTTSAITDPPMSQPTSSITQCLPDLPTWILTFPQSATFQSGPSTYQPSSLARSIPRPVSIRIHPQLPYSPYSFQEIMWMTLGSPFSAVTADLKDRIACWKGHAWTTPSGSLQKWQLTN